jgi:hypothetical protein
MSDSADLQYPVGKFTPPASFSPNDRDTAIEVLAAFPRQLVDALDGLGDPQLDTPYRPGGWTIRQLVHHIADSHMNAYSRLRHALTKDWPTIYAYDQGAWARLPDSALPIEGSVGITEGVHQRLAATLRAVAEADWAGRGYVHPENGRQALEQVLPLYAWHARHHLAHIVNCRRRHGW